MLILIPKYSLDSYDMIFDLKWRRAKYKYNVYVGNSIYARYKFWCDDNVEPDKWGAYFETNSSKSKNRLNMAYMSFYYEEDAIEFELLLDYEKSFYIDGIAPLE